MRIVLAGGGSAGHVNPLLATAAQLRSRGYEISVLGTAEGLEADLVPAAGFELSTIPKVPFPRRPNVAALKFPWNYRRAVKTAKKVVSGAGAVVGFGGYAATPAYSAAKSLGVPIVVHEQNARPGLANRLGARRAAVVATTFDTPAFTEATVVGMPLRESILNAPNLDRGDCYAALGLDPSRPVVSVSGGSLGAQHLNEVIAQVAADLVAAGAQVFHLTGKGKAQPVLDARAQLDPGVAQHYHVREYLVEMELIYAVTSLMIGRSGAGAVCELAALGIPGIYVPLPVGNGEQRLNAAGIIAAGGGKLVADAQFSPQWVRAHVLPLLTREAALAEMAQAAKSFGVVDAASRLADLIEGVLN